jgi:hypothetical protein
MQRLINLTAIHSLIALPILAILLISQPSESAEEKGIANWQVHSACKDALEHDDDSVRKTANFVCRILTDTIYEANFYNQGFINHFIDEGWEDAVKFAEVYSITGCDISELEFKEFAKLYVSYMDKNEDKLEDSYFWTVELALRPYCQEMFNNSIKFHLDEYDGRRKS